MKNFLFIFSILFRWYASAEPFCPSAPPSCSYAAINSNLKETDSSWFFDSPNDTCKGAIPKGSTRPSNDKIYTAMMEDQRITSYVNPSILGCFKNSAGSEEQKIRALSRYAYSQSRFDKAAEGLQDYLAFADLVNGKVPLDKVNCTKEAPEMTKTVEGCQRVKSQCKEAAPNAAKELIQQYENEFKAVDVPGLNKRIKEISSIIAQAKTTSKGRIPVAPATLEKLEQELAEKEIRLEMFYASYPWSRQATFANAVRRGKGSVEALRLQVNENAENARNELNEISKASSCMLRNNCDPDEITDALKKLPPESTDAFYMKKGDTRENNLARGAVTNYLSYNRCLDERVSDWEETNRTIVSKAALPIGILTIPLTMGGSLALTGLTLGGRALVSAAAVGSRTFALATSAARIGTLASATLAVPQVQTAIQHCGEKARAELNTASSKPKNQCSLVDNQTVAFKTKYNDCFMQAVMATLSVGGAGLGLKGLASGGKSATAAGAGAEKAATDAATTAEAASDKVQRFVEASKKSSEASQASGRAVASQEQLNLASKLSDTERVEAASQLLKTQDGAKVLSEVQKKAVVDAHNIGGDRGFGSYTKTDLLQKQRTLKDAGFTETEIEVLMRNGVTGKIGQVSVSHGTEGAKQLVTVEDFSAHADKSLLSGDFGKAQQGFSGAAEKVTEHLNSSAGSAGVRELASVAGMEKPMIYNDNISKLMLAEGRFQEGASERILQAAAELEKKYQVPSTKTLEREFEALGAEAEMQANRVITQGSRNSRYDETTRKWVAMSTEEVVNDAAYRAYKANEMRKRLASEAFQQDRISEELFDKIMAQCKVFDQQKGSLKKVRESLGGR